MGHKTRKSKIYLFSEALGRFLGFSSKSRKHHHYKTQDSKGSALVMAAIFMLVASVLISVGVKLIANASRGAKEKELYVGEAENVARAGLIDALAWFRRQSGNSGYVSAYTQLASPGGPVTWGGSPQYTYVDEPFNPIGNTLNPQVADTIDASIGLVGEYPLSDPVTANSLYWARFEVDKQGPGAMATTAVHDISGERSGFVNGDGVVWSITSTGYVYKRPYTVNSAGMSVVDPYGNWIVPYNGGPAQGITIVAMAQYTTEFRKLTVAFPVPTPGPSVWSSGLYVYNANQCVTLDGSECLLNGGVSAIGTFGVIGLSSP